MSTASFAVPSRRASIEPLENRTLLAAAAPVAPGTIYYADYQMVDFNNNQFPSFAAVYSMKGDGSAKSPVSTDFPGDPSRLLHGGRWMLDTKSVPGTYPNGLGRREIFATPLGGAGTSIQLTNNPNVQPSYQTFWSANDSFISFSAVTWTPVAEGGNYTDGTGNQWLADAEVLRAGLSWSTSVPTAVTPTAVLDVGERFDNWGSGIAITPDVVELDWSPAGTQLAYQKTVGDSN